MSLRLTDILSEILKLDPRDAYELTTPNNIRAVDTPYDLDDTYYYTFRTATGTHYNIGMEPYVQYIANKTILATIITFELDSEQYLSDEHDMLRVLSTVWAAVQHFEKTITMPLYDSHKINGFSYQLVGARWGDRDSFTNPYSRRSNIYRYAIENAPELRSRFDMRVVGDYTYLYFPKGIAQELFAK